MIKEVGGRKVLACDECGSIMLWKLDSNIKHGYICTKCIDKDAGKYRVLDIAMDEMKLAGYDTDILSEDLMWGLSEALNHEIMMTCYWDVVDKYLNRKGIFRSR